MTENYGMDLDDDESKEFDNSSFDLDVTNPESKSANISSRPISKGMIIAEIIDTHPEIIPTIMERGIHCIGCGASAFETLEEGFMGHGIPGDEIDRIVDELNSLIEKDSKKKS
ncbi:MAG: DUF1858 domain-containing protein [Candidatus Woesearchaeota archaeon]